MNQDEKRKRVMARSMRIGHCICDPKTTCPCPTFEHQDLCPCAGEKPEPANAAMMLTRLVKKAGCASKIDRNTLRRVLQDLPTPSDPRVLVGMPAGDDAGVFHYGGDKAWVQTVDVFSPVVDDPYTFGQIAAANSLSDVYAMGGQPLTALSIIGYPTDELSDMGMRDILRGGIDKMAEAGVAVIGGHSILDAEIKAGFAVTGLIDPQRVRALADAQPGDVLVLTKPLGTGILAFAAQIGRAEPEWLETATRSMTSLNKIAAEAMDRFEVHACTDITGFGLLGHLAGLASGSGVDLEIATGRIPLLPGAMHCAQNGLVPGATERNREASLDRVEADGIPSEILDLCLDAQTSGGLVMAVAAQYVQGLLDELHASGVKEAAAIGRVVGKGRGRIFLRTSAQDAPAERVMQPQAMKQPSAAEPSEASPSKGALNAAPQIVAENEGACCAEVSRTQTGGSASRDQPTEVEAQFQAFMKSANRPGALDAATKQSLAIALSVLSKCEPCLKAHVRKARAMGFTQAEIDEAAWMAISFGGSPVMMFYKQIVSQC